MATIQGVYVALFGRPADPTGLAYFNSVTNNGANLSGINNLSGTAEYQARFTGLNNVQIINSIYQSLFGRDADLTGLNFFADALAKGTLNINNIAIAILDGAQGNDKTIVTNKVAAADLYTKSLDTGSEVVAYSGLAAAAQGRAFISGVSTTVPTQAAVDTAVAAMVTASSNGGTGAVGVTLTLSGSADTISPNATTDATKSTAGNDTIRAPEAGNLATADSIDGGAGTDTLNATMALTAGTSVAPVIKNVENINLTYGTLLGTATFNANDVSGAQKIVASDVTIAAAARTFSVTNAEKAAVVELKNITIDDGVAGTGVTGVATVAFRDAAGTADSATVSLNKVTLAAGGEALSLVVDSIENLTLNSTGSVAADTNNTTLSGDKVQKLVITGANDLTLGQSAAAALKTVDASAFTGKLNYTATTNGETISGGAKADTIVISGGTAADTLVYTAANKSTLNNLDSITGFQANTNTTSLDKIDVKAFNLGSTAEYKAASFQAAGDNAGFFSSLGANVKAAAFVSAGDTYIYVDANNNGNFDSASDLTIKVVGDISGSLDKSDFIFA